MYFLCPQKPVQVTPFMHSKLLAVFCKTCQIFNRYFQSCCFLSSFHWQKTLKLLNASYVFAYNFLNGEKGRQISLPKLVQVFSHLPSGHQQHFTKTLYSFLSCNFSTIPVQNVMSILQGASQEAPGICEKKNFGGGTKSFSEALSAHIGK